MSLLLIVSVTAAAVAEDMTVTTYYPSPRGVYNELRTTGDVGVGVTGSPVGARLHVAQTDATRPALRVESSGIAEPTLFVAPNGNVGIRNSNPVVPLHVFGEVNAAAFRAFKTNGAYAFLERGDDTPGNVTVLIGGFHSGTLSFTDTRLDGAPLALQSRSHGNVGIDTSVPPGPGSKLSVNGGVAIGSGFTSLTAPTDGLIVQGNVGIGAATPNMDLAIGEDLTGLNFAGTHRLDLLSNNTITMSIRAGNVGIGTVNPTATLDVNGEAKIGGVAGDGTGKAVCVKSDGTLGTCSSALSAFGTCGCN